jgi:4a-hydroxytetrahydrobiopterin dehydratase
VAESLAQKVCTPCRGGISPLTQEQSAVYLSLTPGWELVDGFVDQIGRLAEEQGHHSDICFGWGYDTASLQTHKIKGLHESDLITAGKISALARL